MRLFAVTAPGIAPVTAAELARLGVEEMAQSGDGVEFTGDDALLARSNLELRTASRVVVRLASFRARTFAELERHAARIDWRQYVTERGAAQFRVTARKCRLYHTGAVAERFARVADVAREPGDAIDGVAQLFIVRGLRDEWEVSADSSGEHLHRRGYRLATAKAPLRETLGAAALLASGWTGEAALVDPFCGSGTICIEGALIAARSAPGAARDFSFTRWPRFSDRIPVRPAPGSARVGVPIAGYDRDAGAIEASRSNAGRAGVAEMITFAEQAVSALVPPADRGWIVTNPPYGVRVGESDSLRDLYARFGSVVRERFGGWSVSFFSADPALERATRLPLRTIFTTENGGLKVRLVTTRAP